MESFEEELLEVSTGEKGDEETSETYVILEELVRVNWLDVDQSFSHVAQSLCYPDHEQWVRHFVVIRSEIPELSSEPGVVSPRPDDSHGEDRITRNILISIIGQLAQQIHHLIVRLGDSQDGESQWNSLLQLDVLRPDDVVQSPFCHVLTYLFSKGD